MDGKIFFYQRDGVLKHELDLNNANIGDTHGMMIRCSMTDGRVYEGFSDAYRTCGEPKFDGKVHDVIYLWTWDHLNEETHRLEGDDQTKFDQTFIPIEIYDIRHIDAILYSNPRWGVRLTNRFFVNTQTGSCCP